MTALLGAILGPLMALVPGFVFVAVYRRNRHVPDSADARFIAVSLVASIFPHLAMLEWTVPIVRRLRMSIESVSTLEIAGWVIALTLIVPAVMGLGLSWLVETDRMERFLGNVGWNRAARTRTGWEWAFTPSRPSWILVTLRDGSLVGGKFGRRSFASLDAERRDLFLASPYRINADGTFGDPLSDALGLWVSGGDIVSVEFYKGGE